MSDTVKCEVCGKIGHRAIGRMAPSGWLYGEARDEDSGSREVIVVSVCSETCANCFWHPGNDRLDLTADPLKKNTELASERSSEPEVPK